MDFEKFQSAQICGLFPFATVSVALRLLNLHEGPYNFASFVILLFNDLLKSRISIECDYEEWIYAVDTFGKNRTNVSTAVVAEC